ncbi:MAG: hypothetical protein KC646_12160 [Candidatus Cloacimonetes bacterium]|nr:hypothetical protein [Candidatus Cloacimonadota bacterium]
MYSFCVVSFVARADACTHGAHGGQCVKFTRQAFGGDSVKMPGLCMFSRDCGAYHAYKNWDLGYGKGEIPTTNSIMVIAKQKDLSLGHVAKVKSMFIDSYGIYQMKVDESNWTLAEKMSCDVHYSYNPKIKSVKRYGGKYHKVAGFIYSFESRDAAIYRSPLVFSKKRKASNQLLKLKVSSLKKSPKTTKSWSLVKKKQKKKSINWAEFDTWSVGKLKKISPKK